ncbi:MAG TPA: hypothetical protein GXX20_12450 [Clostridiaceae bacterium]|nr:hypothetical protein [Clostridiaceae bacterium]
MGVTAFSIVFAEIVTWIIAITVVNEIPFSVGIIFYLLTTPEIIKAMAPNILLGWFMGFLGIFQLFKSIGQEVDSVLMRVEKA